MILKRTSKFLISGAQTFSVLHDLVAPNCSDDLLFSQLSEVVYSHFKPRRLVIMKTFQFNRCTQAADESIAEFDVASRKLATHCEFGKILKKLSEKDSFVIYDMRLDNAGYLQCKLLLTRISLI